MISPLFQQKRPFLAKPLSMHPGSQVLEQKGLIRKRGLLALAVKVERGGLEISAQVQLETVAHPPGAGGALREFPARLCLQSR